MQISFDQRDPPQPLPRINNEERFTGMKPEEQQIWLSERSRWEPAVSRTSGRGAGGGRCAPEVLLRIGRMQQRKGHNGREGKAGSFPST